MHITNVRLGHATNSSSSHSIVLDPTINEFGIPADCCYGWEDFLIRTPEEKARYFATLVYQNLRYGMPEGYAQRIVNDLFSGRPDSLVSTQLPFNPDGDEWRAAYIDHQSVLSLPYQYHEPRELDFDFVGEFCDHVVNNPRVGIAGGNDNQEAHEKVDYGGTDSVAMKLPSDYNLYGKLVCRKDGQYWTLFNKVTGAKVRLSFTTEEPYTHSSTPELVDVKITDFCPFGCDFCYQSSTMEGKHANMDVIQRITYVLSGLQVFEVALGGGETTMHPYFAKILHDFRYYKMVPNFTTFTMNWVKDSEKLASVLENVGGFALSVVESNKHLYENLKMLGSFVEQHKWYDGCGKPSPSLQVVLGVCSDNFITHLMEHMSKDYHVNTMTLLGYKSFGRGLDIAPRHRNNLRKLMEVARKNHIKLGVDTKVVADYGGDLDAEEVSPLLRSPAEGRFSMYIDAVNRRLAKDSYTAASFPFNTEYHGLEALPQVIASNYPFLG